MGLGILSTLGIMGNLSRLRGTHSTQNTHNTQPPLITKNYELSLPPPTGRLLPTRTMVLDRGGKYTRTEYAKAYDAGRFGLGM